MSQNLFKKTESGNGGEDLVIGFDIGTSSLKLVALSSSGSGHVVYQATQSTTSCRLKHEASTSEAEHDEQDVGELVRLVLELLNEIPLSIRQRVRAIQLCGQMHGVLMWNRSNDAHSALVTWQDARCSSDFLANLPVKSSSALSTGFGCATLYWYALKQPNELTSYDAAGTIHDYISHLLSGMRKTHRPVTMSTHNALSWGYFDIDSVMWQPDLHAPSSLFPARMLPQVVSPGHRLEKTDLVDDSPASGMFEPDCSVYVALGDLQCSVYAALERPTDCAVNISTSSQVCVAIDAERYMEIRDQLPPSVTMFPYFGRRVLLVAASLNGGNVLQRLVDTLSELNDSSSTPHSDNKSSSSSSSSSVERIWSRLVELGQEHLKRTVGTGDRDKIVCTPLLFGERHLPPTASASLANIKMSNLSLGGLFVAACRGIVNNLAEMMPPRLLRDACACERLIASGGALLRNPVMRRCLEERFGSLLTVHFKSGSDAALGAALYLRDSLMLRIDE